MKDKNLPVRSLLKGLVVAATIFSLVQLGMPRSAASSARLSLKSESQVRSEASLYDTAVREISRVETMKLTTADDFNQLKALLERQIPNLKFSRSKLVALALSESSLISAAKARTSNNASTEEFARELAADSESIFRLSGATAARDKINRSVAADVTMLGRVADKIQKAAAEFKQKSPAHHAPITPPTIQREILRTTMVSVIVTSLVISAVMIACPPLGIAIPVLTAAAIGGVITAAIVAGAAVLVGRVAANVGTEEGRDRLAECINLADKKYDDCVADKSIFGIPECLAILLIDSAKCLTAE